MISARNPASVKICALLDEPARRETEMEAEYVGFQIPDRFMDGYWQDYAQKNLILRYISVFEFL